MNNCFCIQKYDATTYKFKSNFDFTLVFDKKNPTLITKPIIVKYYFNYENI